MALLDKMEYNNLVIENPIVNGGKIASGNAVQNLKFGTLLSVNASTGKLAVMASGGTADCILAEDVSVPTSGDATVPVFVGGIFNVNKLIVADGYTITAADEATLRGKGIYLVSEQK